MKRRPKSGNAQEQPTLGELIVQTGRHAGARRPLAGPLVLIGRAPGCDVRLQMEGVEPRHCLLASTPDGVVLRDLETQVGTLVNGDRVQSILLCEGDLVAVGSVQFRVHSLRVHGLREPRRRETLSADEEAALRDAWRVQAAAVAAQQIAVEEESLRLEQRQNAFEKQEEQVAAHLEEKRRRLIGLTEEAKAEREALDKDRAAYETYVASIKGDLTEAQRELMEGQRKVEKERTRLSDFNQRLKARWHRFWLAERGKFRGRQAELAGQIQRFEENIAAHQAEEEALAARRLRFNALYEFGRGALREAWSKLRQEQQRWKHRRGKERAALKIRERDLENAERQLVHAQNLFLMDQKAWDAKKQTLDVELRGIDARIDNHRLRIQDLRRLQSGLREQTQPEKSNEGQAPQPQTENAETANGLALSAASGGTDKSTTATDNWQENVHALQALAASLADQRLELIEQWQRLALVYRAWQGEKEEAAAELEELGGRLMQQGKTLADKEQQQRTVEADLRRQNEDVLHLRHQMIGWRARLRSKEHAWEGDRSRLLAEIRHRESLAEQQHGALVDLRQRWSKLRRQEVERLHGDREELEKLRREVLQARQDLALRTSALEDEKRHLAEKAIALEHFRQELMQKTEQASAERKLERFRRRWLTQNTLALRHLAQEREALREELALLNARCAEVSQRADELSNAEAQLVEKRNAWEHQQALAHTRQTRLQEELRHSELQRSLAEQQYHKMRDEVERIARSLFTEPEPPAWSREMAA